MASDELCVYLGKSLGSYGFGDGHPFNTQRHEIFRERLIERGLDQHVHIRKPVTAERAEIERFHTPDYVQRVITQSESGTGFLDYGDTPAVPGIFEAAATVVGSVLDGIDRIMQGECRAVFVPIAGLHHARPGRAAGFCVFNDIGVAIETLRHYYGLRRVAYVDIDAHHGDGVFYAFEDDPDLLFADIHQDGHTLYPGTGDASETGRGAAQGTKLNIPMPPHADDALFLKAWEQVEAYLEAGRPEFIVMQAGADSIHGDPITAMDYSPEAHRYAAERLREIAGRYCQGRLLATGGGGYNLENIAEGWTEVVDALY
jgi:acetoin utilization protein AcuC